MLSDSSIDNKQVVVLAKKISKTFILRKTPIQALKTLLKKNRDLLDFRLLNKCRKILYNEDIASQKF